MSVEGLSGADKHLIEDAYNHYLQQFEGVVRKLDTQRLIDAYRGSDSMCEGCHDMAGNQNACSIEYAGLFGCMGYYSSFDYPDEQELPGMNTLQEASKSSDQKTKQHAEHVLQAIEDSFTRAKEAAIDSIPYFLKERRGYDMDTGMQTLQGKALDQVVYGDHGAAGLQQEQAIDQHKLTRMYPPGVRQILAEGHGIPSWKPVDKENMVRELGEIGEGVPQHAPVETVANTFIHHHDNRVAELVKRGHKERDLKYDTLAEMQKQLSEESRKKKRTGGTRRNKRSKKKSVRAGLRKPGWVAVETCIFTAKLLDKFCETLTPQQLESGALHEEAGCVARLQHCMGPP